MSDEACPGCGCVPGQGLTEGCNHPGGCGTLRKLNPLAIPVTDAERAGHDGINRTAWRRAGAWAYREFGEEAQLRNSALPWLAMDLYRSEVEDLYRALGEVLRRPQVLPYRLSRWERFRQWWLRVVWRRRHYAELAAARAALVDEYTRRGPWG